MCLCVVFVGVQGDGGVELEWGMGECRAMVVWNGNGSECIERERSDMRMGTHTHTGRGRKGGGERARKREGKREGGGEGGQ